MIPQSPIRTLGTPASVSIIAPTGDRTAMGARSDRKSPIAIAIGVAISSARSEVSAVAKMKSSAPYLSVTAFQFPLVMKPSPKCPSESLAWSTICQTISADERERDEGRAEADPTQDEVAGVGPPAGQQRPGRRGRHVHGAHGLRFSRTPLGRGFPSGCRLVKML